MRLPGIADAIPMSIPVPQPDPAALAPVKAQDRRSETRLPVCVPVRVVYVSGTPTSLEGTCSNVTTSGAAFDINAALQVGDLIEFEFCNTHDSPLTYRARILYRNGYHYGAYFVMF